MEFDDDILEELEDRGYDVDLYQIVCEDKGRVLSVEEFEDCEAQRVDNLGDWAEKLCKECYDIDGALPLFITAHIDWEDVAANELLLGDYVYRDVPDGGYIVWRNN